MTHSTRHLHRAQKGSCMQQWPALILAAAALLAGCAQPMDYYQPSDTTARPAGGVTVYGEIDASVGRTR